MKKLAEARLELTAEEAPDYLGHRERLRGRFLQGGVDALADYELLEMILFMAKPRGDMKPLAKELLRRFDNFAGVISASAPELESVKGVGDSTIAALKTVQAAALKLAQSQVIDKPLLSSWQSVLDYCHARLAHRKVEEVHGLFVDSKNRLIADEVLQIGTINHAPLYAREVVKRALELHATALVLVHNHPSGDPRPSKEDIQLTKELIKALAAVDIKLHDHLIIGQSGHASFKALGLI